MKKTNLSPSATATELMENAATYGGLFYAIGAPNLYGNATSITVARDHEGGLVYNIGQEYNTAKYKRDAVAYFSTVGKELTQCANYLDARGVRYVDATP